MKDQPTIAIKITQQMYMPNFAPFFKSDFNSIANLNLTACLERTPSIFTHSLPIIYDLNSNDAWQLSTWPKSKYLTYDETTNALQVDCRLVEQGSLGFNDFMIVIDSGGQMRKLPFTLNIYQNGILKVAEKTEEETSYTQRGRVTARIQQMSIFGLMEVRFNATLNQEMNMTNVNRTVVDIYLVPFGREINDTDHSLNFTWELVNVTEFSMWIQLNFSSPQLVSSLTYQDKIVFHLKNRTPEFFFPTVGDYLHNSSYTLYSPAKRQLEQTDTNRFLMRSLDSQAEFTKYLIILLFLVQNVAPSNGKRYYMWYLRHMQIVLHLPFMRIPMPANAITYFSNLISIVMFDVLSPEWTTRLVLNFDDNKHFEYMSYTYDQVRDLGYMSHSSIMILGSLWIFAIHVLLQYPLFYLLKLVKHKSKGRFEFKFMHKWALNLFFPQIIGLSIEGYLEWIIAAYLNIDRPIDTYFGDKLSNFSSAICLFMCFFVLPVFLLIHLKTQLLHYGLPSYQRKYGYLTEDIRITNKFDSQYFLIWWLRRMYFIAFLLFVDKPHLQLLAIMYSNLAMHIIVATYPLTERYLNCHCMFEEFMIQVYCLHMLCFTDWVPKEEYKLNFGWSMVALTFLHLLYQTILALYETFRMLPLLYLKYRHKLQKFLNKIVLLPCVEKLKSCLQSCLNKRKL